MKKQFYFISTVLGLTLTMHAYNLSRYVSENSVLELKIREHTYRINAVNNSLRRSAHEWLHEMDPNYSGFVKVRLLLSIIDSIEHLRFSSQALSEIRDQLESITWAETEDANFTFLDDRIELTDRHLQFNYYRARIISECWQKDLFPILHHSSGICFDKFRFVQLYEPGNNEYITHFGTFMKCESKYHHVLVNGRLAPDGAFSFTPTSTGWNNLLIEVERYDRVRNEIAIDTFHYPIKVVGADDIPRT